MATEGEAALEAALEVAARNDERVRAAGGQTGGRQGGQFAEQEVRSVMAGEPMTVATHRLAAS